MPGVLTNVVKGTMLGNSDARLKRRAGETDSTYRARLNELLGRFKAGMSEVDHAKTRTTNGNDQPVATNPGQETHTKDEFFGADPAKRFFPDMPVGTEDQIVRAAYIQAIELSLANPIAKSIVSYWIITGRADTAPDAFEVFVAESELEIHVLILTPLPVNVPPPPTDPRKSVTEGMYVVSTPQRIADIPAAWPPGYPITVTHPTPGADCLRVVGY